MKKEILNVLVIGFGRMGKRHAAAYQELDCFDLVGICGRGHQKSCADSRYPQAAYHLDAQLAITSARADVVCIATHVDSHAALARAAIDSGAHVFLEKPVAQTISETEALFSYANDKGNKIVVGYVRKHDPIWRAFVDKGGQLGSPVVIRFCLDQPSAGDEWQVHQSILRGSSLTFDCAVHYVDMMAKICGTKPVAVTGRSVRLHGDLSLQGNYGYLSVEFSDGSVGSFDSAWGPMVGSRPRSIITATGPNGSASIISVPVENGVENEFKNVLVFEPAMTSEGGLREEEITRSEDIAGPAGEDAFVLQQRYLHECITNDVSMDEHYNDVLTSMIIVAAADESAKRNEITVLE